MRKVDLHLYTRRVMCEAYDYREIVLNIFLYKMYTTFRSFTTYEQLVDRYKTLYVQGVIVLNFAQCLRCTKFRWFVIYWQLLPLSIKLVNFSPTHPLFLLVYFNTLHGRHVSTIC